MRVKSYVVGIAAVLGVGLLTGWAVHRFQKQGHLDVITAQSMDMSAMRPPVGAMPVDLSTARTGSLDNMVTYTGTVAAYNEQIITPRITGTVTSLPVYPGDNVTPGQLLAQLDTAEVGAKETEAADNAAAAAQTAQVALLTHHLHHQAALDQASATREAATEGVAEAKAEVDADEASVDDALAGVKSAEASTTYWKTELPREHKLADAGAVSLQDYQNEQNQAAAATAALAQANAKVDEAKQTVNSAKAKVLESSRQAAAADAGARMAVADLTVAEAQIGQTVAGAESAKASQREAQIIEGYARIVSPTAGVVTERPVAPGTLVQPGQEILKVEEIDRVRVQANVAVTDLSGITIGSPVTIITQEGESSRTIFAHVSAIFPAANAETRTAVVEAVVANPGRKLLPGAFVSMKLSTGARNTGLLVPSSAIVSQGGVSSVWAVVGQSASPSTVYVCSVCHMHYSASQAAKLHYVDPMDGGKLLPPAGGAGDTKGPMTVQQFPVSVLGSDGLNSEISADGILPGMEVVAHGADGLTDGAQVVQAAWGADGPIDLPSNSQASSGQQLYRCSKCGMTFSAANAKKDGYIDPMDGGKLLPVSGGR